MEAAQPAVRRIRLGDLLVANNVITDEQLQQALQSQKKTGLKLGKSLIDLGFVKEIEILQLLSEQLQIPFIELKQYTFDVAIVRLLPETIARRFRVLVLKEDQGGYLIGMSDPTDIFAYDEVIKALKKPIQLAVVKESELLDILDVAYQQGGQLASLAEELVEEMDESGFDLAELVTNTTDSDAPVVKLLLKIFEEAARAKASDIHIEPDESVLRVRKRIDGVLNEQVMNEKRIAGAIVVRLKLMSGLDISEKRRPQDGRFNIRVANKNIDVRLSTMPVQFGESVVMRLLDHSDGLLGLDNAGMPEALLKRFRRVITRPHGLILVTGPTGSGKTMTLYGALSELNTPETKIITVEDPVEYRLPRISQVQINEKIGLDFSKVLRATLRQDPDVLLVGEIRDRESAEIALRASMTGHLVLSTLHTNDAVTSALRLIDMGVDGYLVASSLKAVVAQRLVRRICESCGVDHQPDANEMSFLQHLFTQAEIAAMSFRRGEGCPHCSKTGYRGRIGVFEMLEINNDMASALRANSVDDFSRAALLQDHFAPLSRVALDYARSGLTTLEEVLRVSALVEDEVVNAVHAEQSAD